MLIALGKFETHHLIEGMIRISKDQNELHEHNQKKGLGSWKHDDGWGLAYLKGSRWKIKKSTEPFYQDQKVTGLKNIKTSLIILHTRKKSVGKSIIINNCHPFHQKHQGKDFIYCHNGTIKEKIEYNRSFKCQGQTDSEKLFYAILSKISKRNKRDNKKEIIKSIKETLEGYKFAKGGNIILAAKERSYIYIRKNVFPKYYNMRLGKKKDFLVISSEKLKNIPNIKWKNLQPQKVYVIDHKSLKISVE